MSAPDSLSLNPTPQTPKPLNPEMAPCFVQQHPGSRCPQKRALSGRSGTPCTRPNGSANSFTRVGGGILYYTFVVHNSQTTVALGV